MMDIVKGNDKNSVFGSIHFFIPLQNNLGSISSKLISEYILQSID